MDVLKHWMRQTVERAGENRNGRESAELEAELELEYEQQQCGSFRSDSVLDECIGDNERDQDHALDDADLDHEEPNVRLNPHVNAHSQPRSMGPHVSYGMESALMHSYDPYSVPGYELDPSLDVPFYMDSQPPFPPEMESYVM
jgi:hypothetical protein